MLKSNYLFLSQWADKLTLMLMGTGCLLVAGYAFVFSKSSGYNAAFSACCAITAFILTAVFTFLCCAVVGIVMNRFSSSKDIIPLPCDEEVESGDGMSKLLEAPVSFTNIGRAAITEKELAEQRKAKITKIFHFLIEHSVAIHLHSTEDAENLYRNILIVAESMAVEHEYLPVRVKNLSREDIYHLGFCIKYYLGHRNEFGATFIYKVFGDEFKQTGIRDDVEYNVVCRKLTSNEASRHYISLPPSYMRRGKRGKATASDEDIENDLQEIKQHLSV